MHYTCMLSQQELNTDALKLKSSLEMSLLGLDSLALLFQAVYSGAAHTEAPNMTPNGINLSFPF